MNSPSETAAQLKRMRSQRLSERVAEALTERLDQGQWAPGDRLPTEHELAATFDVSRTVIREAISRLRQAGRLETVQGSGTFVAAPPAPPSLLRHEDHQANLPTLVQVLELRRGLEAESAAMAARRRTHDQVMALRGTLQAIEQTVGSTQMPVELTLRLPMQIAQATGNPLYVSQLESLHRYLIGQAGLPAAPDSAVAPPWTAETAHQVMEELRALVDAIATGDAARARREAIRHLLNGELRLRNATRLAFVEPPVTAAAALTVPLTDD